MDQQNEKGQNFQKTREKQEKTKNKQKKTGEI